ncbi:MAG: alpha-hydroxy-acid oxidizing protein [Gemmatimonadetes bacterium]|nr:alpha-hydroxy-acid oxidizing protein [Gemmatimonadota bacterium]
MAESLHVNLYDFEAAALAQLPRPTRDYCCGGANDEITLERNRAAYEALPLHYRVLRDVSERDLSTSVLGIPVSMPILIAPTACHELAHPDGELATARAASAAGTLMTLSTLSNFAMEEVSREARGPLWFQLYVYRDRGVTCELIRRAEAAGCRAIVLTVDAPVGGLRERDVRNEFRLPEGIVMRNLLPAGGTFAGLDTAAGSVAAYINAMFDPSLSWRDLDWLAAQTSLPVVVKGIVRADDAVRALEHGARSIVVSNHGGRQLDTSPATIEVLEAITTAIDGRIEVLIDGGVRRGTDVLKALALGARAVLIGRPILWGLAVGGEQGVLQVLDILRRELDVAMALCGCCSVDDVDIDLIHPPNRATARPATRWQPT